MNAATSRAINWTEMGLVPDSVIRHGIRRLIRQRVAEVRADDCERLADDQQEFIALMNGAEIAPLPHRANEQHYEVPADFFSEALGPELKYSCCYWPRGVASLAEAEHAALQLTCDRAQLADGMEILDLGCGWGSLSLWAAARYPASRITAVSNSASQREFIEAKAAERGLKNIRVITRDMSNLVLKRRFDRIVSIEMFEHMRNYRELFCRVNDWLNRDGRFFMHIFCHRSAAYEFLDNGPGDWMSRHFFSGGMMPSDDLPLRFQEHLRLLSRWRWSGVHYERTANAWLDNMDRRKGVVLPVLARTYGAERAEQWWMRWRIFFMSCAELFGYDNGQQWWVGHYLFRPGNNG